MLLKKIIGLPLAVAFLGLYSCKKNKPENDGFNTFQWAMQGNENLVAEVLDFRLDLNDNMYVVLRYGAIGTGATFEQNGQSLTLNQPYADYLSDQVLVKFSSDQQPEWAYYFEDRYELGDKNRMAVSADGTTYLVTPWFDGNEYTYRLTTISSDGSVIQNPEFSGNVLRVATSDNDKLVIASRVTENQTFSHSNGESFELNPGLDQEGLVLTYYDMGELDDVIMHKAHRFGLDDIKMNALGEVALLGWFHWYIDANANSDNPSEIAANTNDNEYGFIGVFNAEKTLKWSDETWMPSGGYGISNYEVDINNAGEFAYTYTRPINTTNDTNKSKVFVGQYEANGERVFAEIYERNTGEPFGYNASQGHVAMNDDGSFYFTYRGSEYSEYGEETTQLLLINESGAEVWRQEIQGPICNIYNLESTDFDELIIAGRWDVMEVEYKGAFTVNGDSLGFIHTGGASNQRMVLAKFSK